MFSSQSSPTWLSQGYPSNANWDEENFQAHCYSRQETHLNQTQSAPYTPPLVFNDDKSQLVQHPLGTAISPAGHTSGASSSLWYMHGDSLSNNTVGARVVSANGNPYSHTHGNWSSHQSLQSSTNPSCWQEGQGSGFSQLATPSSSHLGSVLSMQSSTDGCDRAERRFKCQYCSKAFTAKHNLQSHIDLKHLNKVKPIHCEFCGKAFTGTRALVRHMENRNACPISTRAK
ncbi:hypothetical protein GYMLUDRAFT_36470 [Collybiopsis luxurians FD-317 M1]|nr:hypothetical protein GYMLUDRAFT_36470 [Collybiopsis luxurians FD-317 M1]